MAPFGCARAKKNIIALLLAHEERANKLGANPYPKLHSNEFECQTLQVFEKQAKPDFSKTCGRRHQPPAPE
jgi:hypothetical protein